MHHVNRLRPQVFALQLNDKDMNILDFNSVFPDEHSCRMDMREKRETQGIVCKKCSGNHHYWLSTRYQWKCADCGFRTGIRSGTVMEHSNLPFMTWYKCIALMGMTKKCFSAHEMQRQLEMKRYEPVWYMMKKLRKAMGQRDGLYKLQGMVEFDEGYFTKATPGNVKLKQGKGSQRKQSVAVMAESAQLEDVDTGRKSSQCRHFKMFVLPESKAETINACVAQNIESDSTILSDKSTSYVDFAKHVENHIQFDSDRKITNSALKWVHIAISNAKRTLLGIYHKIDGENLQDYLDEFCYKLNRRYFGKKLFERILIAVASSRCIIAD